MTEEQWLTCNPAEMVGWLRHNGASERKLRLFCVACCHHSLQCMVDDEARTAIETAELYADGAATEEQLKSARLAVNVEMGESRAFAGWASDLPANPEAICHVQRPTWVDHFSLLRCIFGNPFRPITLQPFLLTSRVVRLAQVIYDGHHFGDMPVLGDALEEAGCDNEDILSHCRSEGPHTRGCWVVDLVLGKS